MYTCKISIFLGQLFVSISMCSPHDQILYKSAKLYGFWLSKSWNVRSYELYSSFATSLHVEGAHDLSLEKKLRTRQQSSASHISLVPKHGPTLCSDTCQSVIRLPFVWWWRCSSLLQQISLPALHGDQLVSLASPGYK